MKTVFQPALSNAVATALPMPVPAPVTIAVFPLAMAHKSSLAHENMRACALPEEGFFQIAEIADGGRAEASAEQKGRSLAAALI